MPTTIVATSDRADLAPVTARWRWEAFLQHKPFEQVLEDATRTAAERLPIPRTLVLLADDEPVGTASLTAHDLDERPDLTPWLAGMFVTPHARRYGYATMLITAIEQAASAAGVATLWLYTGAAERLYASAGWQTAETIERNGKPFALMRRRLQHNP